MKEKLRFRCPCCGMIADVERLNTDGPYELEVFIQRFGGKVKLTDDERNNRKGKPFKRGSGRGFISYEKIDDERREQVELAVRERASIIK